jgi:hypothetical protein
MNDNAQAANQHLDTLIPLSTVIPRARCWRGESAVSEYAQKQIPRAKKRARNDSVIGF